jgi:hypothetical protein
VQVRDRHDLVLVHEKLDGSNCAVALLQGTLVPLTRAGWPAQTSPYAQHHVFAQWVWAQEARFRQVLTEGERLCGEWLAQAHGTRYDLTGREPFVAFDLLHGAARLPYAAFTARRPVLPHPGLYLAGHASCSIAQALALLGTYGAYGALDPIEGAVWRVERRGCVDFVCKYVRPEKGDDVYLPELTGGAALWNRAPAGERPGPCRNTAFFVFGERAHFSYNKFVPFIGPTGFRLVKECACRCHRPS